MIIEARLTIGAQAGSTTCHEMKEIQTCQVFCFCGLVIIRPQEQKILARRRCFKYRVHSLSVGGEESAENKNGSISASGMRHTNVCAGNRECKGHPRGSAMCTTVLHCRVTHRHGSLYSNLSQNATLSDPNSLMFSAAATEVVPDQRTVEIRSRSQNKSCQARFAESGCKSGLGG